MKPIFIPLFGPPGAGKGTNAVKAESRFGLTQISTGDVFRAHIKAETKLGLEAKVFIDKGELVPDDLTTAMVLEKLKPLETGALLDGFPRTRRQGELFEKMLTALGGGVNLALYFQLSDRIAYDRLSGRWICVNDAQHIVSILLNPSQIAGRCDLCGGSLIQRPDDTHDAIMQRLRIFHKQTEPALDFYRELGLLTVIDASPSPDEVWAQVKKAVSPFFSVSI